MGVPTAASPSSGVPGWEAQYPTGTPVWLYHAQSKKRRAGIVAGHSYQEDGSTSWKHAKGWKKKWAGKLTEAITVVFADDSQTILPWDDTCVRDPLPRFFATYLQKRTMHVLQAATVEEGSQLRAEQTRAAATSGLKKHHMGPYSVADKARVECQELLDVLCAKESLRDSPHGGLLTSVLESEAFQNDMEGIMVNPEEMHDPTLALADICARMAAVDAGVHASLQEQGLLGVDRSLSDMDLVDCPDPVAELKAMPPFLRTFLWRFASLRYRPPDTRGMRNAELRRESVGVNTARCASHAQGAGGAVGGQWTAMRRVATRVTACHCQIQLVAEAHAVPRCRACPRSGARAACSPCSPPCSVPWRARRSASCRASIASWRSRCAETRAACARR